VKNWSKTHNTARGRIRKVQDIDMYKIPIIYKQKPHYYVQDMCKGCDVLSSAVHGDHITIQRYFCYELFS